MDNLLSLIRAALPSNFVSLLSAYLGEAETPTQTSLSALLPALLGAIAQKGATPSGAGSLLDLLKTPGVDSSIMNKIAGLLSGRGTEVNNLLNLGTDLMNQLFGDKATPLSNSLASLGGIQSSSAMKLLALAAPVVLGYLRNYIVGKKLDQTATARLLSCQGQYLEGKLDNSLLKALGFTSAAALLSALPCPEEKARVAPPYMPPQPEVRRSASWLPWLLGLLALLGLLYLWQAFSRPRPHVAVTPGVAPVAYCLPANVYFEVGQAVIDAANQETIAKTAACIKKEGLKIAISGYTDRTGDWAANVELAKNRAKVVRDALVAAGVPEAGITLQDPKEWTGTTTGTGTNPEARRVEITKQ